MENKPQSLEKQAEVISLFGSALSTRKMEKSGTVEAPSFFDLIKKNGANKDRLKKERQKANQSVLRSYRIKDN